jgi:hypothetical protein
MKIAPLGFLAAVGIFLVTMAIAERGHSPDNAVKLALELDGIDTVVVKTNGSTSIIIDDNEKSELSYDEIIDRNSIVTSKAAVIKDKNRLFINANLMGYEDLKIALPTSVRYLQLTKASVTAKNTLDELDVQMSQGSLLWNGNAKLLNINNISEDKCDPSNCEKAITINSGVIGQLHIEALKGELALNKTNDLKAIRLSLGPSVHLSVSDANSIKKIQLEDYVEKSSDGVATEK